MEIGVHRLVGVREDGEGRVARLPQPTENDCLKENEIDVVREDDRVRNVVVFSDDLEDVRPH